MNWLYFIEEKSLSGVQVGGSPYTEPVLVKIGVSDKPKERLAQLQTSNGRALLLQAVRPIPSEIIRESYEAEVHRELQSSRKVGEWFLRTQAVLDWKTKNFLKCALEEQLRMSSVDYFVALGVQRANEEMSLARAKYEGAISILLLRLQDSNLSFPYFEKNLEKFGNDFLSRSNEFLSRIIKAVESQAAWEPIFSMSPTDFSLQAKCPHHAVDFSEFLIRCMTCRAQWSERDTNEYLDRDGSKFPNWTGIGWRKAQALPSLEVDVNKVLQEAASRSTT